MRNSCVPYTRPIRSRNAAVKAGCTYKGTTLFYTHFEEGGKNFFSRWPLRRTWRWIAETIRHSSAKAASNGKLRKLLIRERAHGCGAQGQERRSLC